jgi:arsenate reductase (thioredoxin)
MISITPHLRNNERSLKMQQSFRMNALACIAAGLYMFLTPAIANASDGVAEQPVTIICEHGAAKSLIAATLFNQAAKTRGLPFRAISRGTAPDPGVPPKIVEALRSDGVDVSHYQPQKITDRDIAASRYVVAIDVDLPALHGKATAQQWNDVPSTITDYDGSHASLLRHVNALLDELEKSR